MATFRNITCESAAGVGTATWPTTTLILPCTLEVTGQYCNITPSINANIAPTGALALTSGTPGTMDNVAIGGTTALAAKVTTLTTTGNIELGHASDTTIARSAAGMATIEGNAIFIGQAKVKSASTSRNTTTTLAADPDLTATVGTGTYRVQVYCAYKNAGTAPGAKTQLQFTGTVTSSNGKYHYSNSAADAGSVVAFVPDGSVTSILSPIVARPFPGSSYGTLSYDAILVVTVSGTLAVWWAQNTSDAANTTLEAGSYMVITKLA